MHVLPYVLASAVKYVCEENIGAITDRAGMQLLHAQLVVYAQAIICICNSLGPASILTIALTSHCINQAHCIMQVHARHSYALYITECLVSTVIMKSNEYLFVTSQYIA